MSGRSPLTFLDRLVEGVLDPARGLELIRAVQALDGPALDGVFKLFTVAGSGEVYYLLVVMLLWCVDAKLGVRVMVLLMPCLYLNGVLKAWFALPRPFVLDPGVRLVAASGYSMPSGHAQAAMVVWGLLAALDRRRWFRAACAALVVLIGFSRVYLGVHFLVDVLAGWLVGGMLLGLYLRARRRIEARVASLTPARQLLVAISSPLLLVLVCPSKKISPMAMLAGFLVGLIVQRRLVPHGVAGSAGQRAVRFVAGSLFFLSVYQGLAFALPGSGAPLYLPGQLLRHGLGGLSMTLVAPYLFRVLRLVPDETG